MNVPQTQNSGPTKVIIAVGILAGIGFAVSIAICWFKANRKLGKSRTKEGDVEELLTTEVHSVSKDGPKTISTSTAITSPETTIIAATSPTTGQERADIPRPLRRQKSANFRPVRLATPILLPTGPSPLPINFVTATPAENTRLNFDRDSEREKEGQLDRKNRSRSRGRLGQDLDQADTAHRFPEPVEFISPFGRSKSLKFEKPNDRENTITSRTIQVPELTRMKTVSQPSRVQLSVRSNSLDSKRMSISSQPPRLYLNLAYSSASCSQTSLMEGIGCAVAESSSLQRLKPAVVHVRTPSPRMSGGFGAHYGCDPRGNGTKATSNKRNSSC